MGFGCIRGCTGKIGAQECVTTPLKPLCCGDRQPYGLAWERVWELLLVLGLQAKAATRRYAGACLPFKLYTEDRIRSWAVSPYASAFLQDQLIWRECIAQ